MPAPGARVKAAPQTPFPAFHRGLLEAVERCLACKAVVSKGYGGLV